MSKILGALFLLVLSVVAQAADNNMLYVEYQFSGKEIAPDSFDAKIKKLWRIGFEFLRFEDAPHPQNNPHGLIIVSEPDIWIIDRNTNLAQHRVDPGPNFKIHFPLFALESSEKLRRLELGREVDYFYEQSARESPAQEIDGFKCRVLRIAVDDREATLFAKPNGTPRQIVLKAAEYEYTMNFLRYEPDRKPDMSLFQLPLGVQPKK